MERIYCTLVELLDDLGEPGVQHEAAAMRYIRAASDYIDRRIGQFIPVTETRKFDGRGYEDLFIDPCTTVTSVTLDGTAVTSTQYVKYPLNRLWDNGPYNRLGIDPDATELWHWKAEREVVSIVGKWGLYEETVDTGATVATQTDSAATIVLSSGATVSPGAVLLIDSEQELVTGTSTASDSTTNTNEALDATEEEVDVVSGAAIYAGEIIRVEYEQMRVLDVRGNTLVVIRGWNGTAKASHLTAQDVYVYRTFAVERGSNGTTAAAHSADTVYRYLVPYDVNWLCREMAGLMMKKAKSGFAGKVGNTELGETFYHNEFPEAIKQVQRNYRIVSL